MRFVRALRELLNTWQGLVLAGLTVLGAIYYGPRKMLETWDWYWDRFRDNEIFLIVSKRKLIPEPGMVIVGHPRPTTEIPFLTGEIAEALQRKPSSVEKSLTRLRRRGKVERYQDGWRVCS